MEQSPELKKIIEKVQGLLALSKSSNEHEAALALARAEALLEKYRLDMTEVEMMTGKKEDIIQDDDPIFDTDKITVWEARLSHGIAYLYGCTTIRLGGQSIKIIGRASDILFVRYLITYITIELFRISAPLLYKKRKDYKDSWFLGAVEMIIKRLKQAQAETQTAYANPHAVATINNRYDEAMKKLDELYPNAVFKNIKPEKKLNATAYYEGQAAGRTIKLTQDKKLTTKPTLS
jgi:hypothetical protein